MLAGLAVLWLLGTALLGLAVARAGVLPRAPAFLLVAGSLGFAAFEGPFVPVLGQVAVVVFAAAQLWLGVVLVSGGFGPADERGGAGGHPAGRERTQG